MQFQKVRCAYAGRPAVLDGLDLTVQQGEIVAIVGRSGAGKTTILKLVNRLLLPSSGAVIVQGRDTREWDGIQLRRRTGYVFQDVGLFPHMSVADNVRVVPRLEGWPSERQEARARDLLQLVGLPHDVYGGRFPSELSGGQRQRVGLARALAADPEVLLMDEPFGALDPVTRAEIRREFSRIQSRLGITAILVTHDMGEAFSLGHRVAVLDAGRDDRVRHAGGGGGIAGPARPRLYRQPAAAPDCVMSVIRFWQSHLTELVSLLQQHVLLVCVSTAVAVAIGLPAGVMAARRPRAGRFILGVANVAQTIPSLALLGFLLPLPFIGGIGARTALVALTLYALLPIVRSTVSGLSTIDRAIIEAGTAMGMTPRQLLTMVELPLALPHIVSGIRVATVIGVGTATVAAAIGAGGLGEYIFRGLAMVDSTVILAGAIPAAAMALLADGALAVAERWLRRGRRPKRGAAVAAGVGALAVALVAFATIGGPSGSTVVVGSKNFTEQVILGEMVAQALEREGVTVERKLNLGGTFVCDKGVRSGDLDVYVEYTGTAVSAIFHEEVPRDPQQALTRARELYAVSQLSVLAAARVQQHLHDPGAWSRCTGARASDDRRSRAAYGPLDAGVWTRVSAAAGRLSGPGGHLWPALRVTTARDGALADLSRAGRWASGCRGG